MPTHDTVTQVFKAVVKMSVPNRFGIFMFAELPARSELIVTSAHLVLRKKDVSGMTSNVFRGIVTYQTVHLMHNSHDIEVLGRGTGFVGMIVWRRQTLGEIVFRNLIIRNVQKIVGLKN
jgi:hypothetical protein